MNKYYIVEFNDDEFKDIKNISVYRNELGFYETLDYLKSKIDIKKFPYIELISSESEKFIYIEYLYQFKHTANIKSLLEELQDIHRTIDNNMDWIYAEIKSNKND